jgi:hypothetical protein
MPLKPIEFPDEGALLKRLIKATDDSYLVRTLYPVLAKGFAKKVFTATTFMDKLPDLDQQLTDHYYAVLVGFERNANPAGRRREKLLRNLIMDVLFYDNPINIGLRSM